MLRDLWQLKLKFILSVFSDKGIIKWWKTTQRSEFLYFNSMWMHLCFCVPSNRRPHRGLSSSLTYLFGDVDAVFAWFCAHVGVRSGAFMCVCLFRILCGMLSVSRAFPLEETVASGRDVQNDGYLICQSDALKQLSGDCYTLHSFSNSDRNTIIFPQEVYSFSSNHLILIKAPLLFTSPVSRSSKVRARGLILLQRFCWEPFICDQF